jgi:type I restriction enzyme S subunit
MEKGYEKYKNSAIEWMKDIPSSWSIVRLRYLCDITTGDKDTINQEENGEYPFFVRSKDIKSINSYSFDGEAILTAGDGDICKIWHYINDKFDYHQRVYMLSNFKNVDGRYLFYFLKENFIHEVLKLSAKSTVDSLRRPMFLGFPVCLPKSIKEQTQIATYLDYKTGLIDSIIAQKEALIKKLKEQRQAIINEAVTKGLNSGAKLKDSGIEWLGAIPEHWEVKKLKYLGVFQNGVSAGSDYFGSGFPFVSYGDVYNNELLPTKVKGLANSTALEKERFSVVKDDVFFTRTSETVDEIGITSICKKTIKDAVFAGFLIRFRPYENMVLNDFYNYYLRSFIPRFFFVKEMNLVTRASLSQELLKRLPILIPPMEEQKSISIYLEKKVKNIKSTIDKSINSIQKLKEYRQSLISEAVTGKIDVRDWQAPKS